MSDFKDIQDNWEQVEPQIRSARKDGPDLVGEIAKLNVRLYEYDRERIEHEKLIVAQSDRLNRLEKKMEYMTAEFLKVIELYGMRGKA